MNCAPTPSNGVLCGKLMRLRGRKHDVGAQFIAPNGRTISTHEGAMNCAPTSCFLPLNRINLPHNTPLLGVGAQFIAPFQLAHLSHRFITTFWITAYPRGRNELCPYIS